jgi:hypothetical protein
LDKGYQHQHLIAVNYANSQWNIYANSNFDENATDLRTLHGDNTISSPFVDLMSFHFYGDPDRNVQIVSAIEEIQQNMLDKLGMIKPIMFSEGGAEKLQCGLTDGKDVEWTRTLIGSAFTGAANAAMPWDYQYDLGVTDQHGSQLSVYQAYLRSFMEGLDLDGEGWVAQAWERQDRKVGMTYLMRPDGRQITGLIDNWTYNFSTAARLNQLTGTGCYNFDYFTYWESDSNTDQFASAVDVAPLNSSDISDHLLLTHLGEEADYMVAYYDAFHPVNSPSLPLALSGPHASQGIPGYAVLDLDYPLLEIPDEQSPTKTPLLLFRAEHMNSPFNRIDPTTGYEHSSSNRTVLLNGWLGTDKSSDVRDISQSAAMREVRVFPNPTHTGMVQVQITGWRSISANTNFELFDSIGRQIVKGRLEENTLIDFSLFPAGLYNLRLNFSETDSENRLLVKSR